MTVYVIVNKKKKETKIGFSANINSFLSNLQKEDKDWTLIQKESYTSKKNALIRVKQLKNQIN